MDREALLQGLDDAQRQAVSSSAMPLVVLAPAGSGKTRVLTRRIAYRIAVGEADPRHVLALTFTRKAAAELSERLARLGLRSEATIGTFHAVAWGLLRTRWSDQRRTQPSLLDRKGSLVMEVLPTGVGRDRRSAAGELATEIEWAKARMITPDTYVEEAGAAGRRSSLRAEQVAAAYAAYETRKQRAGLVDFDDLLALCARAIEDDTAFAAAQRWRFRHLYVDELQDVNPLQFRLLEAWRGDRYDVTAVGDPQQAIYGWNGADAGFLLDIHRYWPPAEVIELDRSYRSTPEILDAASAVLRAARQPAQAVRATRPGGAPPQVVAHRSDRDEAIAIARAVRLARTPGRPWADQAVLVRTHGQAALLAEALRGAGIPHRVRGGAGFLDRREIRRALRDLRASNAPLVTALADLDAELDAAEGLAAVDEAAGDLEARALEMEEREAGRAALEALVRMGRDYLRLDPLGQASGFSAWLVATVQSEADTGTGGDGVDIATFHAAKGLEWTTVHLAGLEDGYVPIAHAKSAPARAEEARLLYVAMTRAQRELRLTWAEQRTFASKVVSRRRSPLLDPLLEPDRVQAIADSSVTRPPTPPVPDWQEQLAQHRAILRRGSTEASPSVAALHHWRDTAARAARVQPEAILTDHVLARVAEAEPGDVAELGAISGVGPILAGRFGADILAALGRSAESRSDA
jgi:DNA helicase-2/ATP-dependent DNA helicase PcrA